MSYNPKYSILDDMDDDIMLGHNDDENLKNPHTEGRGNFWPSMASIQYTRDEVDGSKTVVTEGNCLRRSFYSMTSETVTELPDCKTIDLWEFGSALEDLYQTRLGNMSKWRLIYPSFRGNKLRFFNKERNISGEVDLVVENKATKEQVGIEIKTYYGPYAAMEVAGYTQASEMYAASTFPYIKVNDPRRSAEPMPKMPNLLQTCLYLEEFWNDIKVFKIIYLARDRGPRAEFDITLTEVGGKRCANVNGTVLPHINLEGIHERFHKVKDAVDNGVTPPGDFVPEYTDDEVTQRIEDGDLPKSAEKLLKNGEIFRDWQCKFCPYLSKCLVEQDKQTSIF